MQATAVVQLADWDVLPLRIAPVRKTITGTPLHMLTYNGSIPGPVLRVQQETTVTGEVSNGAGLEQTVHWHGLRVDNRSGGVHYETQQPIPTGGPVQLRTASPDRGVYWYHRHIREDYAQEWACTARSSFDRRTPCWPTPARVAHILFDATNPGRWMDHCHIAEPIERGMMFSFDVLETATGGERAQ